MIVVATQDFEVYHEVVSELRDRGVDFTTVEPGDPLPPSTRVVVVSEADDRDSLAFPDDVDVVAASPGRQRVAVEDAIAHLRGSDGRTVVGIDPGTRPGIAVLHGDTVTAAFQVPVAEAAGVVREEIAGAENPLVRIGDGARLQGSRIVEDLEGVTVELVDETGTTPYLGTGARGMGDVLAAVNIAHLRGTEIEGRSIEPTAGEIQVIKSRSRERSAENRTIPEALARRVATGDLTLDEAIEEHGKDENGTAEHGHNDADEHRKKAENGDGQGE